MWRRAHGHKIYGRSRYSQENTRAKPQSGMGIARNENRFESLDDSNFVGDYPDIQLAKSLLENLL